MRCLAGSGKGRHGLRKFTRFWGFSRRAVTIVFFYPHATQLSSAMSEFSVGSRIRDQAPAWSAVRHASSFPIKKPGLWRRWFHSVLAGVLLAVQTRALACEDWEY